MVPKRKPAVWFFIQNGFITALMMKSKVGKGPLANPTVFRDSRRQTPIKKDNLQSPSEYHNLQIRFVSIETLTPYPGNARTHSDAQVAQVAASIREFGWTNPILIRPDGVIIAGHARLLAARQLGMDKVPVIELKGLSEAQCRALVIADNQLALNAGWDEEMLRLELAALKDQEFSLKLLGFGDDELRDLLDAEEQQQMIDPDAVPPLSPKAVSQEGDLWLLGDHRLLCGDATRRTDLETVLGGEPADMVFTDPPSHSAPSRSRKQLNRTAEPSAASLLELLRAALKQIIALSRGAIYVCMAPSEWHTLHQAFTEAGGHWSASLIWAKDQSTAGSSEYQQQYEMILYGWPEGVSHHWSGTRRQGDVWTFPEPTRSREHPRRKPVELVERAINNSSLPGNTVLDSFSGSGTTLIACQRLNRRACLIELDPLCVDVICRRWQQYTGTAAVRERDGLKFSELESRMDSANARKDL